MTLAVEQHIKYALWLYHSLPPSHHNIKEIWWSVWLGIAGIYLASVAKPYHLHADKPFISLLWLFSVFRANMTWNFRFLMRQTRERWGVCSWGFTCEDGLPNWNVYSPSGLSNGSGKFLLTKYLCDITKKQWCDLFYCHAGFRGCELK